jgi:hypothetical protein
MKEGVKKRPSRLKMGRELLVGLVEGLSEELDAEKSAMISETSGRLLTRRSRNTHSL